MSAADQPGLLCVVANSRPAALTLPLTGGPLVLGRQTLSLRDPRLSRLHTEVRRDNGVWHFRDLGSRNGTFVDGRRVSECRTSWDGPALRIGDSLFLCLSNLDPERKPVQLSVSGLVAGARLQRICHQLRGSGSLLIVGAPGSGRESLMRLLHESRRGGAAGFHRVDCREPSPRIGPLPDGDTLFLDAVDALAPPDEEWLAETLAARAGRLLIGASAAAPQTTRLHGLLAQPVVHMPILERRREEVPWIIRGAVPEGVGISASFYYRALLASWPGQVRQLLSSMDGIVRRAGLGSILTAASLELR